MKTPKQKSFLTRIVNIIPSRWNSESHFGSIFQNMAVLASGSAGAQIIGVLSIPIITRIYLPEHFGILAVFTSITTLLVPFGTLQYPTAIPLPKLNRTALNITTVCILSLLTASIGITLFFSIFAQNIFELLSMKELQPYWWLIPIAVTGTGLYELFSNWAVRSKAFKSLASTIVWQALIGAITKIFLGLLGLIPVGLLIGQLFNQAGGAFSLFHNFSKEFIHCRKQISLKRLQLVLIRYVDFPKYRLPSQFLLILSAKAPLLFFAWNFGTQATGQLSLALTTLALPMSLFGQATAKAYFAEIAHIGCKEPEKIYTLTKNITKSLILASTPPLLVLLLFGQQLFQLIFGKIWSDSGTFASALSLYLVAQFASTPIINTLTVFGKHQFFFKINAIRITMTLLIFLVSYVTNITPLTCVIFYSLSLFFFYIFICKMIFRTIHDHT